MADKEDLELQIACVVAQQDFGAPTAVKRGRNPKWPYVPVIHHASDTRACSTGRTEQIRRRAFVTREEAIECARRVIARRREFFTKQLFTPRLRALRKQYGLPSEIKD